MKPLSWPAFRALHKRFQTHERHRMTHDELTAYQDALDAYKQLQPHLIEEARLLLQRLETYHQAVIVRDVIISGNRQADVFRVANAVCTARLRLARRERNRWGPEVDQREIQAENRRTPHLAPHD